jgi:two-component system chemotaxis response regulator CheB
MIKVLVVEDSPVARELLIHILNMDADIQVIGSAVNGREAVGFVTRHKPDLITMDIHMPLMDGYETTRTIMESNPVPIVMVTASANLRDLETSFHAIEAGALTVIQKPQGIGHPDHAKDARNLVTTVKLMAEIRVVRRWARIRPAPSPGETVNNIAPQPGVVVNIVAVGASTGGPPVIARILAELPNGFQAPVVIVQHMAEGFIAGFAEWLGQTSSLPVQVAAQGVMIHPGHVYLAPDGVQLKMERGGRICCTGDGPENGLRPSVSYLFRSVAEVYGKNAIGVLLTGMGRDGAAELKLMQEKGAVTIAQNAESSAVNGMPGEAVRLGAARYVLPPSKIAAVLASLDMARGSVKGN